ncbi:MAG: hypothetical protein PHT77_05490 [Bacteroidales bacterium]|nr:hypothetical protein [Bacteroidales bacterium]
MTDWQNRGGVVQQGITLAPMDMNIEHTFELLSVDIKENVQTPYGIKNKVETVWKESDKDQKEAHRVWLKFNESYAEKSGLVGFIGKISPRPVIPGVNIKLGDYLAIGMRIKAMVQARIDKKTGLPSGYYDFIPASIKPANAPQNVLASESGASLANALLIARGARNSADAAFKLAEAKAPFEITNAFATADRNGKIEYPIH